MEAIFREIALSVALAAEFGAVAIIGFAIVQAGVGILRYGSNRERRHGARKEIWLNLGTWLLLGLEFELAADIVRSVISPDWADIVQLAAIAAIRTFLNFFLERDIEKYAMPEAKAG